MLWALSLWVLVKITRYSRFESKDEKADAFTQLISRSYEEDASNISRDARIGSLVFSLSFALVGVCLTELVTGIPL